MNRHFYIIWTHLDGDGWEGPFGDIDTARAAVPDDATAFHVLVPLPPAAQTQDEKREAAPITDRPAR